MQASTNYPDPTNLHEVGNSFQTLIEALATVERVLRTETARLVAVGEYKAVAQMLEKAQGVGSIRSAIQVKLEEWKQLGWNQARHPEPVRPRPPVHPSPRSTLIVSLDGHLVPGETAADVFVSTLEKIGLDRVMKTGKKLSGISLVSTTYEGTYQSIRRSGFHYVCTHASNEYKKKVLEELACELHLSISVELA